MTRHPRSAYTLIELLVAMALAIVLLSIAIAVANSAAFDSYKVVGAGDKLSQMLLTAKSRAQRDKAPRGVRLNVVNGVATEMQYIETAEPWLPETPITHPQGASPPKVPPQSQFVLKYPQTPSAASPRKAYLMLTQNDFSRFGNDGIAVGDIVYAPDIMASFVIQAITPAGAGALNPVIPGLNYVIDLNEASIKNPDLGAGYTPTANSAQGTYETTNFGIYRTQARPLMGEPKLLLPRDMIADMANSYNVTSTSDFDILFAPSGQVINSSQSLMAILLRNPRKFNGNFSINTNASNAGELTLVCITTRTGTIATKPVQQNGSPFQFAKDGINSGL